MQITEHTFETERLILKETDLSDAEFILALVNSPKWLKYIGDRGVYSMEDAEYYISKKISPQFRKLGYGNYTVIDKEANSKIGSCGLYDREGIEGIDLGFAFLPEYEKKGYAYEAASKLVKVSFNDFGLAHLHAITTEDNTASQKLLARLGFNFKETTVLPNSEDSLMVYTILRKEYI